MECLCTVRGGGYLQGGCIGGRQCVRSGGWTLTPHVTPPHIPRPPYPSPPHTTLPTFGNFAPALINRFLPPHVSAPLPFFSRPAPQSHPNFPPARTSPPHCRHYRAVPARSVRPPPRSFSFARTYLIRCPSHRWRP